MVSQQSFPTNKLKDRYKIKSRQSLLNRLNFLGIKSFKEGNSTFVTYEQLELLDRLDVHLRSGEPMATFPFPLDVIDLSTGHAGQAAQNNAAIEAGGLSTGLTGQDTLDALDEGQWRDFIPLIEAIAKLNPQPLLARYYALEDACLKGWHLTSKEVHSLIGSQPKGEIFRWGVWDFHRYGRAGRSYIWLVSKRSRNMSLPQGSDILSEG